MATIKNIWHEKLQIFFTKIIFFLWTAFLIYSTGPYYSLVEFFRNLQIFGYKKLDYEKEFKEIKLNGKVCIITGGTRGIGLKVVEYLLSKNCTIITGSSNLNDDTSEQDIQQFKRKLLSNMERKNMTDHNLIVYPLDLSSMYSVEKFSEQIKKNHLKIDYLICNAGVMFVPFKLNHNRFEDHMAINYYSHCLLIAKLLPLLVSVDKTNIERSRIIMVSSGAHHASFGLRLHDLNSINLFSPYHGYCQSKLSQIMFTYSFNQWLEKTKLNGIPLSERIIINCLHPGICRTKLMQSFMFARIKLIRKTLLFRSAAEGAETILYTTLSKKLNNISGEYFENCTISKSSQLSKDLSLQKQLWIRTWQDLKQWLTNDELEMFLNFKQPMKLSVDK